MATETGLDAVNERTTTTMSDAADTKEREEQAQIIVDATIARIREMGFGVVADGTVHGDGIWIDRLRVRRIYEETTDA